MKKTHFNTLMIESRNTEANCGRFTAWTRQKAAVPITTPRDEIRVQEISLKSAKFDFVYERNDIFLETKDPDPSTAATTLRLDPISRLLS